jgi:Taurine catabolism dioxygenase TauD, TfdA family
MTRRRHWGRCSMRPRCRIGGDMLLASMYAAYDALSDGLKATLEGLRALHSSRRVFGPAAAARRGDLEGRIRNAELATQDAVHPVVFRHADTGRKALYVNPGFTVPLTAGPRRNRAQCSTISTATPCGRNSPAVSSGAKGRSPSETTARPGTSPSTTTTANAACCNASRSPARGSAELLRDGFRFRSGGRMAVAPQQIAEPVHVDVDDRRREQCQYL